MSIKYVILQSITWLLCSATADSSSSKPNIVIIIADDLGWNDVSFHGSNQIPTPNIDALAYNGIILNSHYVPALCSPSRASLLTGKYPTSLGFQHLVLLAPEPRGLPLEETLMPQHLKRHGYSTHAIGKWHLGFHKREYTPTFRGFDTHYGYWNGFQGYYDHTTKATWMPFSGYDMRRNMDMDYSARGKYSTDVFTDEAVKIIKTHNSTQGPLFMYFAHLAPHAGNQRKPFEAPDEEIAKHAHIRDPERRVYAAMVTRMDESVGRVMSALREADMLSNSIILFMADNGAVTFGIHSNHGSNYPLRGMKESPWEGGVRGVAAVWSPLLNQTRRVSNQMMHVSDWLPTLYSAAGFDVSELGAIEGKDMWDSLSHDLESPRMEVFNNYDEIENYSSLRVGPWKYVQGTVEEVEGDLWYGESGEDAIHLGYDTSKVINSKAGIAVNGFLTEKQLENYGNSDKKVYEIVSSELMLKLRRESVVNCDNRLAWLPSLKRNNTSSNKRKHLKNKKLQYEEIIRKLREIDEKVRDNLKEPADNVLSEKRNITVGGELDSVFNCNPLKEECLFNLEKDPCEKINLAKIFPDVLEILRGRLEELKETVVKPANIPSDPFANPELHNFTWTNWCDTDRVDSSESASSRDAEKSFFEMTAEEIGNFNDLSALIFDNVVFRIILAPILIVLNEATQWFMNLVRALLLSFFTAVLLVVASLLLLTAVRGVMEMKNSKDVNKKRLIDDVVFSSPSEKFD